MPTLRQKLVALKMVENGGNMGKAMIEAGYSKAMAKNPYKLTRSKGWAEATDGILSGEKIVKVHAELLDSLIVRKFTFPKTTSDGDICSMVEDDQIRVIYIKYLKNSKQCFFTTPDALTRIKALELAYKVRGLLNPSRNQRCEEDADDAREFVERARRILPR
ncbi:MAG: hypothetical protein WC851_05475 [Candidatus Shapirobacteria bacterium]|jgi:hypothetical protein